MAKKSMILKQQRGSKFSTREYSRCRICGRPHLFSENTEFAVYVLENWLIRDRSLA